VRVVANFLLICCYVVGAGIYLLLLPSSGAEHSQVAAAAVIFFFLWLIYRGLSRSLGAAYPLVFLAIGYHLLAFVWPSFSGELANDSLSTESERMRTLSVVVAALVALSIGGGLKASAYETAARPLRELIARQSIIHPSQWFLFGLVLWTIQFSFRLIVGTVGSIDTVLLLLRALGVSFVAAAAMSGRLRYIVANVIALAVVCIELVMAMSTGSLAGPVFLVAQLLAIRYYFKRRFGAAELAAALMAILCVFALQSVKQQFRSQYWSVDTGAGAVERALAFVRLASEWSPSVGNSDDGATLSDSFEKRASNVSALMTVIHMTPDSVPYRMGSTLWPLTYMWVPRFIWPDKPQATLGNDWPKDYNLLGANDFSTSYNLPWLVEFYINFGVLGVLLGMCVTGYFLRLLERVFFEPLAPPFCVVMGLALVGNLWWLESNVSLMLGNLVTQLFAAVFLAYIFKALLFRRISER
jgi:hypothetical protein